MGRSPAQISGQLALENHSTTISHESIYRYIEHRVAQKDHRWHILLPRQKYYRGHRPKKGGPPSKTFKNYVSIDHRPDDIAARQTPGQWEADLMAFNHNKAVILIAQERQSRKIIGGRQPNKGAHAVCRRMTLSLSPIPPSMHQSITYNNGTEFAQHHLINKALGTKSYFCHTHSPWEKGGVENAIGWLRRYLPSKNKPGATHTKSYQRHHPKIQQYTSKMPQLLDSKRIILQLSPNSKRCTSNVIPSPSLSWHDGIAQPKDLPIQRPG